MLPLIPIFCWNFFFFFLQNDTWRSILVRRLWKPHKPEWQWQEGTWVNFSVLLFSFLLSLSYANHIFCLFVCFTERCGMCNTAYCNLCRPRIVALYFMSMGICKCTGKIYLYFSDVISLIWGKRVLQLLESHKQCKWESDFYFFILRGWQNAVEHLNARYQWTSNLIICQNRNPNWPPQPFILLLDLHRNLANVWKILTLSNFNGHKQTIFCFLWINMENESIFSKPKWSTTTISCHMVVEMMHAFS